MTQQHSDIARSAIIGSMSLYSSEPSSLKNQDIPQTNGVHESNSGEAKDSSNGLHGNGNEGVDGSAKSDDSDNSNGSDGKDSTLMPPPKSVIGRALGSNMNGVPTDKASLLSFSNGVGKALTDTPISTAPPSPQILARSQPPTPPRVRATTLDIPGLTRSKASPDGRISQRDVGSKLVIVMVGLPARGKSYITKKLARYLNWLQHDAEIFNVGERRRLVGRSPSTGNGSSASHKDLIDSVKRLSVSIGAMGSPPDESTLPPAAVPTKILVNGEEAIQDGDAPTVIPPIDTGLTAAEKARSQSVTQSAEFFDPQNQSAVRLREQVALDTLDELLDYILERGGSVGILDATNSTLERRKAVVDHIRRRAGPELGVLFLESRCVDQELLEANMRLKLSGPDYRDQDPVQALADFKKRVSLYEKSYVPLGEYEEKNNMAYIQMIDVGRKIVSHQTNGFLSSQVVYYLLNFNLSPRQIWITRHGESKDDQVGRIGGDSDLSENGVRYAKALAKFIDHQRKQWELYQRQKELLKNFPPRPGDSTPPNPSYIPSDRPRNFCVWSSMLKRSVQTVRYFNEDEYDVKEMRMLDELNAGKLEGMTYDEIRQKYPEEYAHRKKDKMFYRYPGPGGEGYLDIINRLRAVIIEVERTTDHVLLVSHRSVARVLLAYFRGLKRDEVADLDVPLGIVYMLEPKPYGVDFKAYRYNPATDWFDYIPDFQLRQASY